MRMRKMRLASIACVVFLAMSSVPSALCIKPWWFPDGPGSEEMDPTTGTIELEIFGPGGFNETITATGPTIVDYNGSYLVGDLYWFDTEITFINLTGISAHVGQIWISESSSYDSLGTVEQISFSDDHNAYSYFDVYFDIFVPLASMTLHNDEPKHMSATISNLHPSGAIYLSTPGEDIYLKNETEDIVGRIKGASHKIPPGPAVGGNAYGAGGLRLLVPHVGLTAAIAVAAVATAVCVRRIRRSEEKP